MATNIPNSGANDVASDELQIVYRDTTRATDHVLVGSAGQEKDVQATYITTGNEGTSAFSVVLFDIPAGWAVTALHAEIADLGPTATAFNVSIGALPASDLTSGGDDDCYVGEFATTSGDVVKRLGDDSAVLRAHQTVDEWCVLAVNAAPSGIAADKSVRVRATIEQMNPL